MELIIFHYHLLPGGVTGVIRHMLSALAHDPGTITAIRIVTGSDEHANDVIESAFAHGAGAPSLPVTVEVVPEIGYMSRDRLAAVAAPPDDSGRSDDTGPHATGDARSAGTHTGGPIGQVSAASVAAGVRVLSKRIAQTLLAQWGGPERIWWIHNHHLGKNPAFTAALTAVATDHPAQRMILHIHDFPECGRMSNLRLLDQTVTGTRYPRGEAITYVTINSRDRDMLQRAGLPAVYLPNPFAVAGLPTHADAADTDRTAKGGDEGDRIADGDAPTSVLPASPGISSSRAPHERIHTALARHFGLEFPFYTPEAPTLLYPVRSIRRKNVLEAGLVALLAGDSTNVIVTLPGVSQPERAYSKLIETAFREGVVRGLWGIGPHLDSAGITFEELIGAATAIVSSSVQEGFGYQFVTPLTAGKPLIARWLDILPDIDALYDSWPHTWYQTIRVPATSPSLSGPQALLRFRYDERLDRLAHIVPDETVERLRGEVEQMLQAETIDFSFLLPHMQYTYLKDIAHHATFRDQVLAINSELAARIRETIATLPEPDPERVEAAFGLRRFAARVHGLCEPASHPTPTGPDPVPHATVNAQSSTVVPAGEDVAGTPAALGSTDSPITPESVALTSFASLDYQRLLYE